MLRSSLILRPSSARSVRNVFKTSNRTSFTAFVRNAVLPLQRDASLARKSIFALGALSACAAMPRKFTSSEAAEAPKGFKMVRRVADNGDIATVTASSVGEVVNSCEEADVVLIGECHDDATAHRFEEEFLKQCFAQHKDRGVILSLEMFETDVQGVLDEYLAGAIRERDFMADSRAWTNYQSDYRPLVEFARQNSIPVVAANAPRRYVSRVGSAGRGILSLLPPQALQFLPPLPYAAASKAYAGKFQAQMEALHSPPEEPNSEAKATGHNNVQASGHGTGSGKVHAGGKTEGEEGQARDGGGAKEEKACPYIGWSAERTKHMLEAQVLWDATMAHSILLAGSDAGAGNSNLNDEKRAGAAATAPGGGGGSGAGRRPLVVHVCGKFHCEHSLGIPEHLSAYDESVRSLVVVCAGWEELATMEERQVAQLGDFVVVSPPREQKSFDSQHPV